MSYKVEGAIILWFITFCYILSFNKSLELNLVWDAIGWIFGSFISTIVLIFVVRSYQLQKTELLETRKILEWQEEAMKEEKIQSLVIELLTLSQKHIENFIKHDLYVKYPTAAGNLIEAYNTNRTDTEVESDVKNSAINSIISYFRTLKYIEDLIFNNYGDNTSKRDDYLQLLESQITKDIRMLYVRLSKLKSWKDLEKIQFQYLFNQLDYEILPINESDIVISDKGNTIVGNIFKKIF